MAIDLGRRPRHAYWAGAGIACRVNGHDYFVIEVGGVGGTGQALTAVRCFENSPFPEVRRGGKMLDMIITDTEGIQTSCVFFGQQYSYTMLYW